MSLKANKPTSQQAKKLVLLDAHALIHRAYHALPNFTSAKGEPTGALYGLAAMLLSVIKEFKPDQIIAAFDLPGPTFRDELYKEYKGKRQKIEDDLVYQLSRAKDLLAAFDIPCLEKAGFEADDILGTLVEKIKDKDTQIIVASGDMDTMSLLADPRVRVYTLKTGIKEAVLYDAARAKERYSFAPEFIPDYKALRGDPSDNIIGVPGVGEKTATELVQKFGHIDELYKTLKKDRKKLLEAGFKERIVKLLEENQDEARFSLVLATIRVDAPIEFKIQNSKFKIDTEKVKRFFEEVGFKSLISRLSVSQSEAKEANLANEANQPNPDTEYRVRLAHWLLDSNNTEPAREGDLVKLEKELGEKGLKKIYEQIELPLVAVLKRAQERGIKVDRARLEELAADYHKKQAKLENEIWKQAGEEFNIASPRQLSRVLFEKLGIKSGKVRKTSTGQISTRAGELDKLKGEHKIVDLLLEYREISKLLSTYVDVFPDLLDKNERLHTHFVQWGTATGRLSSRDPNLQNIPIKTEQGKAIREIFVAEKNFLLGSFDYSQIDLRSLALLSGDEKLIDFFQKGGDIHADVAAALFKVPKDKVDREQRRRAKVINFGIVYGMGVLALKQNLGSSRAEAEEFYRKYFETFPGVTAYLDKVKKEAREKGYTETYYGRRRYYPEINRGEEYMQRAAERQAANAPIQGTTADIIKLAMIEVAKLIEKNNWGDKVYLLLQIHDELIYEIDKRVAAEAKEQITKAMEAVAPSQKIPFPVKASLGPSWGEL